MSLSKIKLLTRLLYPIGRAWKMPFGGILDRLHSALAISEAQYVSDSMGILDSILPDNANFTVEDARMWERRLGLIVDETMSLEDRLQKILRKYRRTGSQVPRQHPRYIESELQRAGFNVKVYKNRWPGSPPGTWVAYSPSEILGGTVSEPAVFSDLVEFGDELEFGGQGFPKVVNFLEADKDALFLVGTHYRNVFYISGDPITTFAEVPASREKEFRQLILMLKPAHMAAYLFVDFV